jgi:hypothetical protein
MKGAVDAPRRGFIPKLVVLCNYTQAGLVPASDLPGREIFINHLTGDGDLRGGVLRQARAAAEIIQGVVVEFDIHRPIKYDAEKA